MASSEGRASEPPRAGPISEAPYSESPASQARQLRAFVRAFCATNYLLGKRGRALPEGLFMGDGAIRELAAEVTEQLSHGLQANRARVLAAEVGRLMRSLSNQKLK